MTQTFASSQGTIALTAAKLRRAIPQDAVVVALAAAAASAIAGGMVFTHNRRANQAPPPAARMLPPAPPPLLVRQLAPEAALTINREIPVTRGPNPAARPFAATGGAATRAQALECLTGAVYYEAGSQDDDGERAVAQVVLNRVRHPAFPGSVCGVVYQGSTRTTGCQFTFTCDGSLERRPDVAGWARARRIADAALSGAVYGPVGYATHYHANYVVPYWASSLAKNAVVGAHIFYHWAGGWGRPEAFAQAYSGREPSSQALRTAALAAVATRVTSSLAGLTGPTAKQIAAMPGASLQPHPAGRVSVRFNLAARKAADTAPHAAYVDTVKASDNLRFMLGSDSAAAGDKPLGKASAPTVPVAASSAVSAGSAPKP